MFQTTATGCRQDVIRGCRPSPSGFHILLFLAGQEGRAAASLALVRGVTSRIMDLRIQVGRPLLLLMLAALGTGLIWHIGHNLVVPQPGTAADKALRQTAALPVSPPESDTEQTGAKSPVELKPSSPTSPAANVPSATSVPKRGDPAGKTRAAQVRIKPPGQADQVLSKKTSAAQKDLPGNTGGPRLSAGKKGQLLNTGPIVFSTGIAVIRPASFPALDKLVAFLEERTNIKLEIAGYTDNLGAEPANQELSAERAAAVKDYMVAHGIHASRLDAVGKGSSDPTASNDNKQGRQANRRIEFRVTSPK